LTVYLHQLGGGEDDDTVKDVAVEAVPERAEDVTESDEQL
jgi:hypothetical protein